MDDRVCNLQSTRDREELNEKDTKIAGGFYCCFRHDYREPVF